VVGLFEEALKFRRSGAGLAGALALLCARVACGQTAPLPAPAPAAVWHEPTAANVEPRPGGAHSASQTGEAPRLWREKTGSFPLREIVRLRLETDLGNVFIRTDARGEVRYLVRLETDQHGPAAERLLDTYRVRAATRGKELLLTGRLSEPNLASPSPEFPARSDRADAGRLWVSYELSVPRNLQVQVDTAVGNIQMQDSQAAVNLETGGGNITIGNVGAARLSTQGGHIVAGNVAGDLHAQSGGGHITAANIGGEAVLVTAGGHIHAGKIGGAAQLQTGGGNISVDRAGGRVSASSAGGQINFGEASGAITAHTEGGGIRVLRVARPIELDSHGGSILLPQVENQVHALSSNGSITAWFAPSKLTNSSELAASQGDIVIYLPRSLAVTIDATVESPDHGIVADPALPLKVNYLQSGASKSLHGECALNGGGEVLRLRTVTGNIQLRYADSLVRQQRQWLDQQLRLQLEQAQEQFSQMLAASQSSGQAQQPFQEMVRELEQQQQEMARQLAREIFVLPPQPSRATSVVPDSPFPPAGAAAPAPPVSPSPPDAAPAMTEMLWMKLGELWWGGVRVDGEQQQKRAVYTVQPEYPEAARQAGIQGTVELRILVDKDGRVQDVRGISGEQVLVNAATEAVRKWRYRPLLLKAQPVPVVTTVRLEFRIF
jgi:TonB family protein